MNRNTKLKTEYFRVDYTSELEVSDRVALLQYAIVMADTIRDAEKRPQVLRDAIRLYLVRVARRWGICGWCHMVLGEHAADCEIGGEIFEAQRLTGLHETPPEELP